ncbi:4Fe-4S ferredoxin [Candidatus Bathyarchaeota archaeon]|nr:MAG: 4Fe-4S ferredoxin [Candidatus Bathyarchaeota archaeon]
MPVRLWREPLDKEKIKKPIAEIHIIRDNCKGCGYCIEFCPKNVLEKSNELNKRGVHFPVAVRPEECVICSFCSAVCPEFAIFVFEKVEVDNKNDES